MNGFGSENALREREKTNRFLGICVILVGLLVAGALAYFGVQSGRYYDQGTKGFQATHVDTLGNRSVALDSLWLNCKNYEKLYPEAPPLDICKNMPAQPPSPPPVPTGGT